MRGLVRPHFRRPSYSLSYRCTGCMKYSGRSAVRVPSDTCDAAVNAELVLDAARRMQLPTIPPVAVPTYGL